MLSGDDDNGTQEITWKLVAKPSFKLERVVLPTAVVHVARWQPTYLPSRKRGAPTTSRFNLCSLNPSFEGTHKAGGARVSIHTFAHTLDSERRIADHNVCSERLSFDTALVYCLQLHTPLFDPCASVCKQVLRSSRCMRHCGVQI
jgi:hypothetical protein